MIAWIFAAMVMHPGHMTRIEIRASDDATSLEVAMRIDSTDLEAALKRRLKKAVDVQSLSDEDAKQLVGDYLRQTLSIDGRNRPDGACRWVGWQRHPRHVWVYFELPILKADPPTLKLRIRSLFEVEPELRHLVVLGKNVGDQSIIITDPQTPVVIRRSGD